MNSINNNNERLIQTWCENHGKKWLKNSSDITYFHSLWNIHKKNTLMCSLGFMLCFLIIACLMIKKPNLEQVSILTVLAFIMSVVVYAFTLHTMIENPHIKELLLKFEKDLRLLRRIQKNPGCLKVIEEKIEKADNIIVVFVLSRRLSGYKKVLEKFGIYTYEELDDQK